MTFCPQPCTGCGCCCLAQRCEAAEAALGDDGTICPFLRLTPEGQYRCRLVEMEAKSGLEPMVARGLGIGTSCSYGVGKP